MFEIFAIIIGTGLVGFGLAIFIVAMIKMQDENKPKDRMICMHVSVIGVIMVASGVIMEIGAIRSLFYS